MPGEKTCGHRGQDGLRSWLICICASLSAAIVPGFSYSFGVLLPHLMEHFSSDRQSTGKVLFKFYYHSFILGTSLIFSETKFEGLAKT